MNQLPAELRSGRTWHYCLLGEKLFQEFRSKGATMEETLQFARVRAQASSEHSLLWQENGQPAEAVFLSS